MDAFRAECLGSGKHLVGNCSVRVYIGFPYAWCQGSRSEHTSFLILVHHIGVWDDIIYNWRLTICARTYLVNVYYKFPANTFISSNQRNLDLIGISCTSLESGNSKYELSIVGNIQHTSTVDRCTFCLAK